MDARAHLMRLARAGDATLSDSALARRYAFCASAVIGGLMGVFYLIFYTAYDAVFLDGHSLDLLQWAGLWPIFFFALPLLLRWGEVVAALVAGPFTLGFFVLLTYLLGADSGMHLFIVMLTVNGMLLLGRSRLSYIVLAGAGTIAVVVACEWLFVAPSPLVRVDEGFLRAIFASVIFSMVVQLALCMRTLMRVAAEAEDALAAEHARSEALLHNLLPDRIAARLKDRPGEVIADGLPAVTLLFADIVDFTPRSARMAPEALVSWLNRIFSAFDVLTAERGLEKIKTIGDAYMVAAGLPLAREDHAEVIADMALAMQETVARLSAELGEPVELRIGIHSGPAIAGVIGTAKVFYDVWGDTVNTASRMESHGEPGRIQVTDATRVLLAEHFAFAPRGRLQIKGVGLVETFWLTGRR